MLKAAVNCYQSGLIDAAKVIEELVRMAQDIREGGGREGKMNPEGIWTGFL